MLGSLGLLLALCLLAPLADAEEEIFGNLTLDRAECLANSHSDLGPARAEWTRALAFMHRPGWCATAAMRPICLRFARLAGICLAREQIGEADGLLRAALEFPFHRKEGELEIDRVSRGLVEYYQAHGQAEKSCSLVDFAGKHLAADLHVIYRSWLDP